MATFISTVQFTEQGMKDIKATGKRAESFKSSAAKMGVDVRHVFWTMGRFDGLVVFDAPNEETAAAVMLQLSSRGNVHTETMRAYESSDMEQILGKLSD